MDAIDEHTDAMMDALAVEPNLIDADVGADLRHGWTDLCTVVDGEDEASALRTALAAIRSAAHNAGAATPGWEADLEKVMATMRPVGLDLDDDYDVPTQSTVEPVDCYAAREAGFLTIKLRPKPACARRGEEAWRAWSSGRAAAGS